jgi:hypothetical protein
VTTPGDMNERTLVWEALPRHTAKQIMDDLDTLGNDASLGSKMLWGRLNSLFGFYPIDPRMTGQIVLDNVSEA